MSKKILEIKSGEWIKGLSLQSNLSIGGLFQRMSNCDPFDQAGQAQPSYTATQVAISTFTAKYITNVNFSGTGYWLAHADSALKKVLNVSPYTVSDVSSSIDVSAGVKGAIMWNGRYIYSVNKSPAEIRSWDLASSDVTILSGLTAGTGSGDRPMCIGGDGNLYIGDVSGLSQCIINTGTTGNTLGTSRRLEIDYSMIPREILYDGRYLVILADNNTEDPTTRIPGDFRCRVYFWDMVKSQSSGVQILSDVNYNFPNESYIIGARILDGVIYVAGYNGIYICNAGTQPKMIRPFIGSSGLTITLKPLRSSQLTTRTGSFFWADAAVNGQNIYGYGNPITGQQKIFYQPYSNSGTGTTALTSCDSRLISASANNLWVHNDTGSTRGAVSTQTTSQTLSEPYRLDYIKVTLSAPLSSGQSVICGGFSGQGQIMAYDTRTYSATNPKQTFNFRMKPTANLVNRFEEFSPAVSTGGGAAIQRIAVYATPLDDSNEDL